MTDLHALIRRMADELDHYRQLLTDNSSERHPLATEARAALARWGRPSPQPTAEKSSTVQPADGEVAELVEGLRLISGGMSAMGHDSDSWFVARAAELLERLSPPQPIPVTERLPGDELCWWYEPDEDDDPTGYGGNWTLLRIRGNVSVYTHWLPSHALPLPSGVVE